MLPPDSDAGAQTPDGSGGPHVFVADIDSPSLIDTDHDHLAKSLRLRSGDPLTVSDGAGSWRPCRFGDSLEVVGPITSVAPPTIELTVAFALTKGSKPEFVVQKLTELGIDRIFAFAAERSIPSWDPKRAAKNLERFRRIAREAAMQSRRVRLPTLGPVSTFAEASTIPGAVRADRGGEELNDHAAVLIGPEGGWSDAEQRALPAVTLGPNVLRAETAAVAAAVLLAHRRSS